MINFDAEDADCEATLLGAAPWNRGILPCAAARALAMRRFVHAGRETFMKKILLVATGGTHRVCGGRLGVGSCAHGRAACRFGSRIDTMCDFDVVQPMNIDSTNMRPADWVRLADVDREILRRLRRFLSSHARHGHHGLYGGGS